MYHSLKISFNMAVYYLLILLPFTYTQQVFPLLIGGSTSVTTLTTIAIDSSSNIAFGGQSSDTSLVGSTTLKPFIAKQLTNGNFQWSNVYTQAYSTNIDGMSFNSAGTKIAVTLESSEQNFAVIDAVSGSVLNYYFRSSFVYYYYPKSILIDSSDNLYIGATIVISGSQGWILISIDTNTDTCPYRDLYQTSGTSMA